MAKQKTGDLHFVGPTHLKNWKLHDVPLLFFFQGKSEFHRLFRLFKMDMSLQKHPTVSLSDDHIPISGSSGGDETNQIVSRMLGRVRCFHQVEMPSLAGKERRRLENIFLSEKYILYRYLLNI